MATLLSLRRVWLFQRGNRCEYGEVAGAPFDNCAAAADRHLRLYYRKYFAIRVFRFRPRPVRLREILKIGADFSAKYCRLLCDCVAWVYERRNGREAITPTSAAYLCHDRFRLFRCEVSAIGVMEHQRAHAGLGFHHHAFGELDSDIFGAQ